MNEMKVKTGIIILTTLVLLMPTLTISIEASRSNPNKIHGSPEYVLNILGKKSDWNPQGSFDNPDRHTIFVPENTTEWLELYGQQMGIDEVRIWMTSPKGADFAVLDGNAFDDGNASLQLGSGRWYVYVVALAKPGGKSKLEGFYYDKDNNAYLLLGEVHPKRIKGQPVWENATDLFYIDYAWLETHYPDAIAYFGLAPGQPLWIFDFLNWLSEVHGETDYYFWKLDNNGCKHLQVRLY